MLARQGKLMGRPRRAAAARKTRAEDEGLSDVGEAGKKADGEETGKPRTTGDTSSFEPVTARQDDVCWAWLKASAEEPGGYVAIYERLTEVWELETAKRLAPTLFTVRWAKVRP